MHTLFPSFCGGSNSMTRNLSLFTVGRPGTKSLLWPSSGKDFRISSHKTLAVLNDCKKSYFKENPVNFVPAKIISLLSKYRKKGQFLMDLINQKRTPVWLSCHGSLTNMVG
jgi:hypothetical protein